MCLDLGTHFTCFTSTKIHILTQKAVLVRRPSFDHYVQAFCDGGGDGVWEGGEDSGRSNTLNNLVFIEGDLATVEIPPDR